MTEKKAVNYLYFSLLLATIIGFTLVHFLSMEKPIAPLPLYFLFYSICQAAFEVSGLLLISYLLKHLAPRPLYSLYIALCFVFLLLHFTNFVMLRVLDSSIVYFFKFLFGFGLSHFLIAMQALNLNLAMIATCFALLLFIPFLGLLLYHSTHWLIQKKPIFLSFQQIASFLVSALFTLLLLDLIAYSSIPRTTHSQFQKTLPFAATFFSPPATYLPLPSPLAPSIELPLPAVTAASHPNLYFFVLETLRKDFITPEIAPTLFQFGQENLHFSHSFSNASSTQLSWYAIFHSDFPYHWAEKRKAAKQGSLPLQILKKLGYKIRVYTSADLHYFDMDRLLFGDGHPLIDHLADFSLNRLLEPCERDAALIEAFQKDIQDSSNRDHTIFLFFFDGTHSEYSFPPTFPLKFLPIVNKIDYLTLQSKDIEPIRNRYRNAIAYLDTLLAHFFSTLKKEALYDTALIALTGDHGEEFYEEGALFHGTHLNHVQTSVPLYFKFPDPTWRPQADTATHMDMFPTLLHYLTHQSDWGAFFKGESIFTLRRWPYRIAVLQNGPDNPSFFTLYQNDRRLAVRLIDSDHLYTQKTLELLSLEAPDESRPLEERIQTYFPDVFTPLLQK